MADYNNIDIVDFLTTQLNIKANTDSAHAVKELFQLFSIKCQKNQVQSTFENLIDYLKVYRKDSSLKELDFSEMQLKVENLLKRKFNLSDTITYRVS